MTADTDQGFDFDAWAALARRDPAAFEQQRAAAIEDLIQQAPAGRRHRLRGLQWRIDRTRERASNPMAACIRISQMMWDSVLGKNGLLEALDGLHAPPAAPTLLPRAKVVDLQAAANRRSL